MLRPVLASVIAISVAAVACSSSSTSSTGSTSGSGAVSGMSFTVGSSLALVTSSSSTACSGVQDAGSCSTSSVSQELDIYLLNRSGLSCAASGSFANAEVLELYVQSQTTLTAGTYEVISGDGGSPSGVTAEFGTTNAACAGTLVGVATSGTVTVAQISESNVSGSYDLTFGSDGSLSGSFSLPVCAPPDAGTSGGGSTCMP